MDSLHFCLLVLGLVCVLSVQSGLGDTLECHVCNSQYEGEDCADPMTTDRFLQPCNGTSADGLEYAFCRKVVQNVEDEYRVVRQCGTRGRDNQCVDRTGTKAIKITYCECDSAGCNSANSVFSMSVLLLTMGSALLALICHS